jgi:hypothetical protein
MNFLKDVGTKAKGFVGGNRDKIDKGLAKAADLANKKTKGKHQDKIDKGLAKVSATLDKVETEQRGGAPGTNPAPGDGSTQPPTAPPQS